LGRNGIDECRRRAKNYIPQIDKLLTDESPTVQIAAAGLLCKLNTPENALPVLGKWMNDERLWLALYAARTIQEAGKLRFRWRLKFRKHWQDYQLNPETENHIQAQHAFTAMVILPRLPAGRSKALCRKWALNQN
jgi:hypothetical protein